MVAATDELVRWYKSKVDWWLVPLLAIPPIASLVVTVSAVQSGNREDLVWGAGSILLVVGIYVGLVFPMRYGIGQDSLIVRFGLCRQRVALSAISKVYPTRNPLSSPALSLDRLRIQYGQGIFKAVMISPAERERFLKDLATSAGLQKVGDCLERR